MAISDRGSSAAIAKKGRPYSDFEWICDCSRLANIMGGSYTKVTIKNETTKTWTVCLEHAGGSTHADYGDILHPASSVIHDVPFPKAVFVQFGTTCYGRSSNTTSRMAYQISDINSTELCFRIRPLGRKSVELYQDGKGRLDTCGHPDDEGDLREQRENERKQREAELQKQIQKERADLEERFKRAKLAAEPVEAFDVPTRKQFTLQEHFGRSSFNEIKDDEVILSPKSYNDIVESQPAFKEFEQMNSLQNLDIADRCEHLISFVMADYCDFNEITSLLHLEVLSVTQFDEVRLLDKLLILDALTSSIYNLVDFVELEDVNQAINIDVDSNITLFLRLAIIISQSNQALATPIVLHCLERLAFTDVSFKLNEEEKQHMSSLIFNKIWSPIAALEILSYVDVDNRSYLLHMAKTYRINSEYLLRELKRENHQSNSTDAEILLQNAKQLRRHWYKRNDDIQQILKRIGACKYEIPLSDLGNIIAQLAHRMKNDKKEGHILGEAELKILAVVLTNGKPSSEFFKLIDRTAMSAVVAILAAIQALIGHTVNIVMTTEVGGQKEVERWRAFYLGFDLNCCFADSTKTSTSLQSNIIYGTVSQLNTSDISMSQRMCLIFCDLDYESPILENEKSLTQEFKDMRLHQSSDKTTSQVDNSTVCCDVLHKYKRQFDLRYKISLNDHLQRDSIKPSLDSNSLVKLIENLIDSEHDKSFKQLLKEIKYQPDLNMPQDIIDNMDNVVREIENIKKHSQNPNAQLITERVKSSDLCSSVELANVVVGLSRHVEKHTGYFPRNNQILALVSLFVNRNQEVGRLLEVSTGEGKSTIVAMFAAMKALQGSTVDVITSSEVLARRDAEEWNGFYKDLGLSSCSIPVPEILQCNNQDEVDSLLRRKYQSNIIYGTTSEFAADLLRHEFQCRDIRGNRGCQVVIVDEVDSMMLDNGLQLTYLSHNTTSLKHMEQVLASIWCLLSSHIPFEDEASQNKVWAATPQYIHTRIAENTVDTTDDLDEEAFAILEQCVSKELMSQDDYEDLCQLQQDGASTEKFKNKLKDVMNTWTPEIQMAFIESQNLDNIVFKYYKLGANKKLTPLKETYTQVASDDGNKVSVLLLDKGRSCELYSEDTLTSHSAEVISQKIKYSDVVDVKDLDESTDYVVPLYLRDYIDKCLPTFIQNGLKAMSMTNGREYLVVDGRDSVSDGDQKNHTFDVVVPVDFEGTGVLEKHKKWADGLQQFLEMKHQLAISPVSTVTNFMSNYYFFKRYLNNGGIYGVSGTLGDSVDRDFLVKHFHTKCFSMPTHKRKKLIIQPMVQIPNGREAWMSEVCIRVRDITSEKEVCKGQSVLLVCEDLKTAQDFEYMIKDQCTEKVYMYTRSDLHNYKIEQGKFKPGDVIITTTLGGRGTDYKVDKEVNHSGGLFVLLTFFPQNMRVEKQMTGRTARKGDPGMAQLILDKESLPEAYRGYDVESMHAMRLLNERERINNLVENELTNVIRREDLFEAFCGELQKFKCYYTDEEKHHRISPVQLENPTKFDYIPGLNSVKEKWAFWLILNRKKIENDQVDTLKADLLHEVRRKIEETQNGSSNNFYDHARNAMSRMALLGSDSKQKGDCGAFQQWQKLVNTEKLYNAVALYNQAYITIKLRKDGYKKMAVELLDKTLSAIKAYTAEMIKVTSCIQLASASGNIQSHLGNDEGQTNFSRQQLARGTLISGWSNAIANAKAVLSASEQDHEFNAKPVGLNAVVDVSDDVMEEEMMLMVDMGMTFVFQVEAKKKFKFSWDALWCCVLGSLQVLAGVIVIAFSLGAAASVGTGLISEGISDMIEGIQGMITGSFSWAHWAIAKAISLAISLIAGGLSAIKRAAKTAWKGVKYTAAGFKAATNMATNTATKQALKANIKLAGKYVVQEIGKQAVMEGTSILWNKGCTAVFEKILRTTLRDIIKKSLHECPMLKETLRHLSRNAMPTLSQTKTDVERLDSLVEQACFETLTKTLNNLKVFDQIGNQLDRWKGIMTTIASKCNVNVASKILVAIEITQYTKEVVKLVSTWPTSGYVKNTVAPALTKQINDVGKVFPEVDSNLQVDSSIEDRLEAIVCKIVTKLFVEKISQSLVSMSKKHACQCVSAQLGKYAANYLGRAIVDEQFTAQSHSWDMKIDSEDKTAKKILPEDIQKGVEEMAREAADPTKLANDLHLNVLVKTGLIEDGKGVIIDIVDENGKHVTSNHFEGKHGTEPIRLRLVQTKQGNISLMEKLSGKSSSYSGHFEIIKDGKVVKTFTTDENKNCLYLAIAADTGQDPYDLQQRVAHEIQNDSLKWAPAVQRQKHFDTAYNSHSLFTLRGGVSKYKDPKRNSYIKEFTNQKPKLSQRDIDLQLGTVDEYTSRSRDPRQKREALTQQDHIPANACQQEITRGKGLAVTVRTEHHKVALSTDSYRESAACRKFVKKLRKTDEKSALYASYVIAHPESSNMIREAAGLQRKDYGSNSTEYYTAGFIDLAAITAFDNENRSKTNLLKKSDMKDAVNFIKKDMFNKEHPIFLQLVGVVQTNKRETTSVVER